MALMVLCGKRYTLANVAAALTMALSAFCFAVGARQADADFNFLGVLLNGLYLLFQALQVALQVAPRQPLNSSRRQSSHSSRRPARPDAAQTPAAPPDLAWLGVRAAGAAHRPPARQGRRWRPLVDSCREPRAAGAVNQDGSALGLGWPTLVHASSSKNQSGLPTTLR